MMEQLRIKLIYWMCLAVLGIMMAGLGQVVVMLYYPYATIDVKEPVPIANDDGIVKRGEQLIMVFDYYKHVNKDCIVTFQLYNVDTKHYPPTITESSNVFEGEGIAVKTLDIPKTLPIGNYKVYTTVKYEMNMFRTMCKRFSTVVFKVVQ